jgi:SPP1 family predicted phage head-tail adaptor
MNAGELNRRIIIQSSPANRTSNGYKSGGWTDKATVWAALKVTGSREHFYAQKTFGEITAVIIIRYRTDIDHTMRISCGGRIFEIVGTPYDPDGRRVALWIPVKEAV